MDNNSFEVIRENLRVIRENIGEALGKYRSSGDNTDIMAVTKTVPAVLASISATLVSFGFPGRQASSYADCARNGISSAFTISSCCPFKNS